MDSTISSGDGARLRDLRGRERAGRSVAGRSIGLLTKTVPCHGVSSWMRSEEQRIAFSLLDLPPDNGEAVAFSFSVSVDCDFRERTGTAWSFSKHL